MKLDSYERIRIESRCRPLIEKLKSQHVSENPDKKYNYLIDFYLKWGGNYLYFCEKYKSVNPDNAADEYEEKFLRLEVRSKNNFNFSYLRHTGKWSMVASQLTLNECLEMIEDTPTFHPV